MDSKHSFEPTYPNPLLKHTLDEFGSVTDRHIDITDNKNQFVLKEDSENDIVFNSEQELMIYLKSEISDVKDSKV